MKKAYETPSVEVVKFNYNDQVVVASGECIVQYVNYAPAGQTGCQSADAGYNYTKNV